MKKFILNLIFYIICFLTCVFLSGHIEEFIHRVKCSDTGYYKTGNYAVINLDVFECDFHNNTCVKKTQ